MSVMSVLLKLARKILEQVLNEVNKQTNRVQQEVMEQMQKYITQGFDDIWRGEDAEQFKEKVSRMAIPQAQSVIGITTGTHDGLIRAAEVVTRADQQVAQLVSDLNNKFSSIY